MSHGHGHSKLFKGNGRWCNYSAVAQSSKIIIEKYQLQSRRIIDAKNIINVNNNVVDI